MMMSVILLRTCRHGEVIAAQARMKLHSAQDILLMHVEVLQSKNARLLVFLTCNLKRYFYYCGLDIECLNTKITAFTSVETVTTGSLKRTDKTLWLCVRVYCVSPILRNDFM